MAHTSIRSILLGIPTLCGLLAAPAAQGISLGAFGPTGEGGATNGQTIAVGSGGRVFELDAFVGIGGLDANGAVAGTTAQLSLDLLPAGLAYDFQATLSDDGSDLVLRYELRNTSGAGIADLGFFSFLDAEIDEPQNGFFNEFAETSGTLAPGQSFEVDEPGFAFGDVFDHLRAGTLDGSNAVPETMPDDVSMALGFDVGLLDAGAIARFELMLSEDGDRLGSFAIAQRDSDPGSEDVLTWSGRSTLVAPPGPGGPAVPEPGGALLFAVGATVAGAWQRVTRRR